MNTIYISISKSMNNNVITCALELPKLQTCLPCAKNIGARRPLDHLAIEALLQNVIN
jgi:hypothetical protein